MDILSLCPVNSELLVEHLTHLLIGEFNDSPSKILIYRLSLEPLKLSMAGKIQEIVAEGEPNFAAYYWIESPDVLTSDAWGDAIEEGRWAEHVRPYTKNRRHVLRKVM